MKHLFALFLVLVAATVGPTRAQDQHCPRPIDWWPVGPSFAVAVDGNHAFAGSGGLLEVADITDRREPSKLTDLPIGEIVWDIALQGRFAYVAAAFSGLVVVDIDDPERPSVVGRLETEGIALRVVVRGPWAFLATAWGGVRIIDIREPGNPSEVGFLESEDARGMALVDDRLYVADGFAGLSIYDLSDEPVLLASVMLSQEGAEAWDVAVAPGGLVVVSGSDGIELFDVSDPTMPHSVGTHPLGGWSLELMGDLVYVAAGWGSLQVIDVSDPSSPEHVGGLEPPGDAYGLALEDGAAFVANGEMGLLVVDLTMPTVPEALGSLGKPGFAWRAEVADEHLFVADGWAGLRVFDVSEADYLAPIASLDLNAYVHGIATSDHRAYLAADWDGGLQIVDISTPAQPEVIGGLADGSLETARGVAVHEDLAFVGSGETGLFIVDVSDPVSPSILSQLTFDGLAWVSNIEATDDLAFVAAGPLGLRIVDVSDPSEPLVLSGVATDDFVWDVAVLGDYAFLAEGGNGIKVVDISDPTTPLVVAAVVEVGEVWGIEVDADFVYLASTWAGFVMLDVSTPQEPAFAGWSPMPGTAVGLAVDGDRVFVMGGEAGVVLFETAACGGRLQADFSFFPEEPREGQAVSFVDLSIGEPGRWTWDFGDGTSPSNESDPTHVFAASGDYSVRLTVAFSDGSAPDSITRTVHVRERVSEGCEADDETLCLNQERFAIEVSWVDFVGNAGVGHAVPLTHDTGYFWFFDNANIELVVKVLDGIGVNGYYWVFYGALSNVEFELTVTDTETGAVKSYSNPMGQFASRGDTSALPGTSLVGVSGIVSFLSSGYPTSLDSEAFAIGLGSSGLSTASLTADFTWTPVNPTTGQSVSFTDRSAGGGETWCWTFGDEAPGSPACSSTSPNPTHVFSSSGSFPVKLTVSSSSGSTGNADSTTKTVVVASGGQACNYVVTPGTQWIDAEGGIASIRLTVEPGCSWSMSSNRSWVSLDPPATGQGNATLSYSVEANPSGSRSASITISGDGFNGSLKINQQGGFTSGGTCQPNATTLCLREGRFEARVKWEDFQGNKGDGRAVSGTSDTGYYWFFSDTNVELIVKVLDGRSINGKYWVFYGALTSVEFELTVTDKETGASKTYFNPKNVLASVGDTEALPGDS